MSSTTQPAAVSTGCNAGSDQERLADLGLSHAWIQMVSDRRGYAVMGHTIVGTTDGRTWQVRYRAPEDLEFVDAVDATHVWAVGARSLFASTDGGVHWTVSPRTPPLTRVHFTGDRQGWAVADSVLLRTDDGGRSWRRTTTPCPVDRTCFAGAQHGWIATPGAVYETNDAGAHWTQRLTVRDANDPTVGGGVAGDLQCTAGGSAWVLFEGYGAAAGNAPYIGYRCANGACVAVVKQNYFPPPIAGIDGPGSYPGPFSVVDDHTAVFVGNTPPVEQPMTMMLVTDDGRGHGPRLTVPDGTAQEGGARAVSFTSREVGWILDTVGISVFHILARTNGGRSWTQQFSAPES